MRAGTGLSLSVPALDPLLPRAISQSCTRPIRGGLCGPLQPRRDSSQGLLMVLDTGKRTASAAEREELNRWLAAPSSPGMGFRRDTARHSQHVMPRPATPINTMASSAGGGATCGGSRTWRLPRRLHAESLLLLSCPFRQSEPSIHHPPFIMEAKAPPQRKALDTFPAPRPYSASEPSFPRRPSPLPGPSPPHIPFSRRHMTSITLLRRSQDPRRDAPPRPVPPRPPIRPSLLALFARHPPGRPCRPGEPPQPQAPSPKP